MSLSRRLERLEASAAPTTSGHRSPQLTPEEEAERERQFEELFWEAGFAWPPAARDPAQLREELFAEIAQAREETDTRE